MHFFVTFTQSHIPSGWKENNTGWTSGNCPMCVINGQARPDKKRRGGFHFGDNEWVYHCFNCDYKTGWHQGDKISIRAKNLLRRFGIEQSEIQRMSIALMRESEQSQLLRPKPAPKPQFIPQWPEIKLPQKSELITEIDNPNISRLPDGLSMLSDRELLHWHDWAYAALNFKYRNRIILPYRYQGKIVGFNARYIGTPPPSQPKYLVTKPPQFIFNLDRQVGSRQYIIVTEGDFDAISIDGVAVGTNSISKEQASIINQFKRKVIILPDFDQAGADLLESAINNGWYVSFPEWMKNCKDANEATQRYGRTFVLYSILNSVTDNPTKIKVMSQRMKHI